MSQAIHGFWHRGIEEEGGPRFMPVRTRPEIGRNPPCPCGSGKKYKHCHGRA